MGERTNKKECGMTYTANLSRGKMRDLENVSFSPEKKKGWRRKQVKCIGGPIRRGISGT